MKRDMMTIILSKATLYIKLTNSDTNMNGAKYEKESVQ